MDNSVEDLIRLAGEAGAKFALESLAKERARLRRQAADSRLRNTKLLLRNYRDLKLHCSVTVSDAANLDAGIQDVLQEIWEESEFGYDAVTVEALRRSITRTTIMINHIDDMLSVYKLSCERSGMPEETRRCRVIHALYIDVVPKTAQQIADDERMDIRTVYKDVDKACNRLSAYLFGVEVVLLSG
jgi:hypothetical protein